MEEIYLLKIALICAFLAELILLKEFYKQKKTIISYEAKEKIRKIHEKETT